MFLMSEAAMWPAQSTCLLAASRLQTAWGGAVSHEQGTPVGQDLAASRLHWRAGCGPKGSRKVDTRLPGKGKSNSRGAGPVYSFR